MEREVWWAEPSLAALLSPESSECPWREVGEGVVFLLIPAGGAVVCRVATALGVPGLIAVLVAPGRGGGAFLAIDLEWNEVGDAAAGFVPIGGDDSGEARDAVSADVQAEDAAKPPLHPRRLLRYEASLAYEELVGTRPVAPLPQMHGPEEGEILMLIPIPEG